MGIARTAVGVWMIALVPLAARAQAATVSYQADLGKAVAHPDGQIAVGGVQWTCNTMRCSGKGLASDSVAACHALSQRFGPLKSFSAAGRSVDVKKCSPAPAAMQAPPLKTVAPVGVAVAVNKPPAAPPAAPPMKKSAAPGATASASGAVAVQTQTLRVNGTGPVLAVAGATGTRAVRTLLLRVAGTGPVSVEVAPAIGIRVRTAALTVMGAGPVTSH